MSEQNSREKDDERAGRMVKVTGVPIELSNKLNNIAQHVGVTKATLIKTHLPKILEYYPDHYTQKRDD